VTVVAHALGALVAAAFFVGGLVVAFEPALRQRRAKRRAQLAAVNAVLAAPIKLPVTAASRAMRARRANVVWSLPASVIADKLGPYDAECADIQQVADLFADEVDR
jgi:hypothetical protein